MLLMILSAACLRAQGLDPSTLLSPPGEAWPTYYGDYTGERYSHLSQIDRTTIKSLTLAWIFNTNAVAIPTGDAILDREAVTITSVPLEVNGFLYFTLPDHVWAVDGRTGRLVWHFYRPAPGPHAMNAGVAMNKNQILFGTSDAHVIALDAHSGKKMWDATVGDVTFGESVTTAPLIVRNHIIIGLSGLGANVPGIAMALNPDNGSVQWKWEALPPIVQPRSAKKRNAKPQQSQAYGGGNPAMTPTYDSALNLLYFGTTGPRPTMAGTVRPGANLYSNSIVALDVDTGHMVWYFQTSPHDTHGWDSTQPTVLFDATFKGRPRKLLAQANRNGYFFVLDRSTGENLISSKFTPVNWSDGVDKRGQPIPKAEKEPRSDGVLVLPGEFGATSWVPPSFSPDTQLFYVTIHQDRYGIYYSEPSISVASRRGGATVSVGKANDYVGALDYHTGGLRWKREAGGSGGTLSTAGGFIVTSEPSGRLLALDAETGNTLWYSNVGPMSNSAITYQIDGRQYIVTPVERALYAWALPEGTN